MRNVGLLSVAVVLVLLFAGCPVGPPPGKEGLSGENAQQKEGFSGSKEDRDTDAAPTEPTASPDTQEPSAPPDQQTNPVPDFAETTSSEPALPEPDSSEPLVPERPPEPDTCNNGTQDPGEKNVDCGGRCPPCVSSLTRWGITWTFSKGHRVGKFVNGDDWVLGPVKLVQIKPQPKDGFHGFEINPSQSSKQPYDKRGSGYDPSLMPSIPSKAKPLTVKAGSSIVSTESNPPTGKCNNRDKYWPAAIGGCTRSVLRGAAILTVLSQPPPSDAFRPPYMGSDKRIRYKASDLDRSKLSTLPPVAGVPKLSSLERNLERPWLDHQRGWNGAFLHPGDNMHNYGREISKTIGRTALVLQLDFSKLPNQPSKETLLIRFVQLGLDLVGMIQNGQVWPHDGGHGLGRKLPVLFAGVLLQDKTIRDMGAKKQSGRCRASIFQEDSTMFYISDKEVQITNGSKWSPDKRATPRKYTNADKSIPEWGIRHFCEPNRDNFHWGATYRGINATGNAGNVLAAHIMGLVGLWNHPPLFDYIDRWAEIVNGKTGTNDWDGFMLQMWNQYRNNYGCRWTRDSPANTYSQGHYTCGTQKLRCTWQNSKCSRCKRIQTCKDYPNARSKQANPCRISCP